jgi:hypothetical protein
LLITLFNESSISSQQSKLLRSYKSPFSSKNEEAGAFFSKGFLSHSLLSGIVVRLFAGVSFIFIGLRGNNVTGHTPEKKTSCPNRV